MMVNSDSQGINEGREQLSLDGYAGDTRWKTNPVANGVRRTVYRDVSKMYTRLLPSNEMYRRPRDSGDSKSETRERARDRE